MEADQLMDLFRIVKRGSGTNMIVYIADEDVIGRKESDPQSGIVLEVPKFLSTADKVNADYVTKELLTADILVLYGEKIINIAVSLGLVSPESVLDINGLKHVQVFKFLY